MQWWSEVRRVAEAGTRSLYLRSRQTPTTQASTSPCEAATPSGPRCLQRWSQGSWVAGQNLAGSQFSLPGLVTRSHSAKVKHATPHVSLCEQTTTENPIKLPATEKSSDMTLCEDGLGALASFVGGGIETTKHGRQNLPIAGAPNHEGCQF